MPQEWFGAWMTRLPLMEKLLCQSYILHHAATEAANAVRGSAYDDALHHQVKTATVTALLPRLGLPGAHDF
jgi:hypothetical protein